MVRWYEGDFSQSVEEHNLLWEWDNNSTGKAYELATPEQEEAYILEQAKSENNKTDLLSGLFLHFLCYTPLKLLKSSTLRYL